MTNVPDDRRYRESHEWALDDGGLVSVGITEHAVGELGDLVHIELPEVGETVTAGEAFGEIESVKAVSELYSPVSGEVVEINEELEDALDRLVESPYDAGWMVKIKASDTSVLEKLLDADAYQKQLD